MKEKHLLIALVIAGTIVGYISYTSLYAPSETVPTPTPVQMITFEEAVEYALKGGEPKWKFSEYRRLGEFEGGPFVTPDGIVEGRLEWRASNGTLYEVMPPFIRDIRGKVLHIEAPDDREEYNVWEITTENKVYYIDARNGIIRLILGETPLPPSTKLLPAYSLDITFPSMPVTVRKGESVTSPVAIKSWALASAEDAELKYE